MNRAPRPPCRPRHDCGFALVVTLIMVTLAAVIVVALLVNASMERTTASSYANRFGAELAVQNGLEGAKKALLGSPSASASVTADDSFLVLRAEGTQSNSSGTNDAYYFLGKAQPGAANKVDCYPLFSGGTPSVLTINLAATPSVTTPVAPTSAYSTDPAQETFGSTTKLYPALLPFQQPAFTEWQEVSDPNDTATAPAHNLPYQRYTFWIEDLGGYLDASVVGNEVGAPTHQRAAGTNPNEIALFTLFDPALASDSGTTQAKALIESRAFLLTGPTLGQVAPVATGRGDVTQRNLAVRLGVDAGGEQNLIPFGFGFPDEGAAKTNLNTVIADTSKTDDQKVGTLAAAIDHNLPSFAASRKGALAPSQDYLKTLAANAIGYATGQAVVAVDYRGIGLHPFVVEFFERFTWEKHGGETTYYYQNNGTWWADVRVIGYIEFWNMFDQPINSGTIEFTDINRYYAYVGGDSEAHKFDDALGKRAITFNASNALQPNEFRVFKVYEHLYNFDSGLTVYPTGTYVKLSGETELGPAPGNCGYVVTWNGKIIERAGDGTFDGARADGSDAFPNLSYAGLERIKITLTRPTAASDPTWRGTLPGLRYQLPSSFGESIYNLGDPRSAYLIRLRQAACAYDVQSAWGGRMYQNGLVTQSNPWKAAETTVGSWPEGGHSTGQGSLPADTTTDPMTLTPAVPEYNKAPSKISGTGTYTSVTELSRVYDPIQWRPAGFPPSSRADFEQKWQDAWKSNMIPDANYGCASTLRIGSPEFKDFDTKDARASGLLDLFSVADRKDTRGMINLNTAGREALRALAAGIQFTQDPAIIPSSVFGPVNDPALPTQADKFADTVIKNRPLLSNSQLAGITTVANDRTSNFFGNGVQWASGGPAEWNDAAREEYFARLFNLTTVRSRNFRVFVTGQALDKNGKVLSTIHRVFQVSLDADRDGTGKIAKQSANVRYEKDL